MGGPELTRPVVGVVGPSGAGKSTLIAGLEGAGFHCKHIGQEHSYVPSMWQQIANPDCLVFLKASYVACTLRRHLNWLESDHAEEMRRLTHALAHADLVIDTNDLTPREVLTRTLDFLKDTA